MPLIKPRANRIDFVSHTYRLQEPNRETLVLYGRFINESPDYVLNQLIETTIARDREFIAFRTKHEAEIAAAPHTAEPSAASPHAAAPHDQAPARANRRHEDVER